MTDESVTAAMEFEVDGIIFLYHRKQKGVRNRALEVIKMRGTKIPDKTFPFDITKEGIEVDTSKTVE